MKKFLEFFALFSASFVLLGLIMAILLYVNSFSLWSFNDKSDSQNTEVLIEKLEKSTSDIVDKFKHNEPDFINITYSIKEQKITTRDNLFSIYSSLMTKEFTTFNAFLDNYLVWLMLQTNTISKENAAEISKEEIIEIKNFVSSILQSEKENNIFEGVNQDDLTSLYAIKNMTLDSDNSIAINNEVYKLAASLKEKQERINLEGRINKIALAISLLSLIVTVIFSYTTNSLIKKKMPK